MEQTGNSYSSFCKVGTCSERKINLPMYLPTNSALFYPLLWHLGRSTISSKGYKTKIALNLFIAAIILLAKPVAEIFCFKCQYFTLLFKWHIWYTNDKGDKSNCLYYTNSRHCRLCFYKLASSYRAGGGGGYITNCVHSLTSTACGGKYADRLSSVIQKNKNKMWWPVGMWLACTVPLFQQITQI